MGDLEFSLEPNSDQQDDLRLQSPDSKSLPEDPAHDNQLGGTSPTDLATPSPRGVDGWNASQNFPFSSWIPESGPLGEKDISLFLDGIPFDDDEHGGILTPVTPADQRARPRDSDSRKGEVCLQKTENLSDERIATLFRDMVQEEEPNRANIDVKGDENVPPVTRGINFMDQMPEEESCSQLLHSAMLLGQFNPNHMQMPFQTSSQPMIVGNARSETQHSDVTGERTISTAHTGAEGSDKPPPGPSRRRRRAGGSATKPKPNKNPATAHLSPEELKRLRRVKNRESVEKCRTKQRLRMEALQIEQTCLQGENTLLQETLALVEKNLGEYIRGIVKTTENSPRLDKLESLIRKSHPKSPQG